MRIHEEGLISQGKSATDSRAQRILRIHQMNLRMLFTHDRHQSPCLRIFRIAGRGGDPIRPSQRRVCQQTRHETARRNQTRTHMPHRIEAKGIVILKQINHLAHLFKLVDLCIQTLL